MSVNKDEETELFNIEFGKKLRKERKYREISQEKIAELAHVSKNTISMVEKGELRCTVPVLLAYCKAMNMAPNNLLDYPSFGPNLKLTSFILTMSPEEQLQLLEIAKIIHKS